jgi:2-amino-4-hydroxy-6-hydroxymethyldihydropteridine diphosphokinase
MLNRVAIAYISLGSNIGDREAALRLAVELLNERAGNVTALSSSYETEPVGYTAQPMFLNAAARLETQLPPEQLMEVLLAIERELGRDRAATVPKGPRTIDLDLLLYDDLVVDTPQLTVPHPAMHQRRFVLEPLVEIAPDAFHPALKRSAASLLAAVRD